MHSILSCNTSRRQNVTVPLKKHTETITILTGNNSTKDIKVLAWNIIHTIRSLMH